MLRRRRPHEVDQRQRHFPLGDVDAEGLADDGGVADEVEDVVLDLEGDAEGSAEALEVRSDFGGGAGEFGAEEAAGGAEGGGLPGDDVEVGFFVEVEVVAVLDLEEFAFAEGVGGVADEAAGALGVEGGAEVVGVGDEEVAEEDGGLVAL